MIIHEMHLEDKPFEQIKNGQKNFELRLNDEKRRELIPGEILIFINNKTGEKLMTWVKMLYHFPNFQELYRTLPMDQCGYAENETPDPADMEKFYSQEDIKKWGVLAIELIVNQEKELYSRIFF